MKIQTKRLLAAMMALVMVISIAGINLSYSHAEDAAEGSVSASGNAVAAGAGEEASSEAFEYTTVIDGVTINITAEAGILPTGTEVTVNPYVATEYVEAIAEAAEVTAAEVVAYDITFTLNGEVIEPAGMVNVSFLGENITEDTEVYHVVENDLNQVEELETTATVDGVTVTSDSFSIYGYVFKGRESGWKWITNENTCYAKAGDWLCFTSKYGEYYEPTQKWRVIEGQNLVREAGRRDYSNWCFSFQIKEGVKSGTIKVKCETDFGRCGKYEEIFTIIIGKELAKPEYNEKTFTKTYDGQAVVIDEKDLVAKGGEIVGRVFTDANGNRLNAAPTEAGQYYYTITTKETDEYEEGTKTYSVIINKAASSVTAADQVVDYNGSEQPIDRSGITVSGTDGSVNIYYKLENESDNSYTETAPTNAGLYTVKIVAAENGNYASAETILTYEIKKIAAGITLYQDTETLVYNGRGREFGASNYQLAGTDIPATLTYVDADENQVNCPTDAGTYTVTIINNGDANHYPVSATAKLVIDKADREISLVARDVNFAMNGDKPAAYSNYTVTVSAGSDDGELTITFTGVYGNSYAETSNAPSLPGWYELHAKISGGRNYNDAEISAKFRIKESNKGAKFYLIKSGIELPAARTTDSSDKYVKVGDGKLFASKWAAVETRNVNDSKQRATNDYALVQEMINKKPTYDQEVAAMKNAGYTMEEIRDLSLGIRWYRMIENSINIDGYVVRNGSENKYDHHAFVIKVFTSQYGETSTYEFKDEKGNVTSVRTGDDGYAYLYVDEETTYTITQSDVTGEYRVSTAEVTVTTDYADFADGTRPEYDGRFLYEVTDFNSTPTSYDLDIKTQYENSYLSGAEYKLYKDGVLVTPDENGNYTNLTAGEYVIEKITPPDNYSFENTENITITVNKAGYPEGTVTAFVRVVDKLFAIDITAVNTEGQAVAGAGFVISRSFEEEMQTAEGVNSVTITEYVVYNEQTGEVYFTEDKEAATVFTTNEAGKAYLENALTAGTYTLEEVKVPVGYYPAGSKTLNVNDLFEGENTAAKTNGGIVSVTVIYSHVVVNMGGGGNGGSTIITDDKTPLDEEPGLEEIEDEDVALDESADLDDLDDVEDIEEGDVALSENPLTGDEAPMALAVIGLIAAFGFVAIFVTGRKKEEEQF